MVSFEEKMMRPTDALQHKDKISRWHQVEVVEQAMCPA